MENDINQENYIAIACAVLILLLPVIRGVIFWINTLDWVYVIISSVTTFIVILFSAFILCEVEDEPD